MRNLAGSLLAGMLLQFNPLLAQEELTASLDLPDGLVEHNRSLGATETYHSDTSRYLSDWDFVDWDSGSFNPYKEQDLKEPFFVKFNENHYAAPVQRRMVVTSRYGWRDGQLHRGIDIDLVTGDEVFAMLDGKVRYVRSHAGHGRTVVIRHKNGLETIYAHLSKQLVEENQIVRKGEVIGKGGTTGNARGSHLHLEVRYEGITINPEYFFDFEKDQEIRARESWITEEIADPRRFSSLKKASLNIERELAHTSDVSDSKEATESADPEIPVERISLEATSVQDQLASVDPPVSEGPYTIKYGDTLYSLARKHGTTVEEICQVNGIKDSFKIRVGQKIILDF
ncbi:MAG: peptidoglycan DD-metalloendopeptidase family protein [Saprospiraceae bacterium]|nr:peptidoglycan DD-metalloendopeptidase family protein [Saprospiraceae bacterium]